MPDSRRIASTVQSERQGASAPTFDIKQAQASWPRKGNGISSRFLDVCVHCVAYVNESFLHLGDGKIAGSVLAEQHSTHILSLKFATTKSYVSALLALTTHEQIPTASVWLRRYDGGEQCPSVSKAKPKVNVRRSQTSKPSFLTTVPVRSFMGFQCKNVQGFAWIDMCSFDFDVFKYSMVSTQNLAGHISPHRYKSAVYHPSQLSPFGKILQATGSVQIYLLSSLLVCSKLLQYHHQQQLVIKNYLQRQFKALTLRSRVTLQ